LGRLSVLGIAFLIVFPWLARNQILYGDPLASRKMLEVVDFLVSHRPITSPYFVTMFPRKMAMSFIGMFGWMNLPLPNWLYLSFGLLVVISVIGYVRRGVLRQVDPHLFFILPTFPILSMAVAVYLNLSYTQAQGRFLFPALSAMVLMAAMGLERLPFWSKQLTYYLLGILFLVNLFIVGTIIIPAYQL
jgi:hypothetical protein